ncbi:hypothetical protein JIG36_00160 [Actinoplanes sp. LDG1-06]|uniref:Uncharacterized protein n=1 Tax=Paractinoplanes ovalisporus TaxID=2810368 RepID=A0ABS2A298_9ACTN|nr:DUF6390 family protein [Actinoplanes ovalisporus]MBM2613967.1 hypothetical protein [Actinoplanes ovalisporus]
MSEAGALLFARYAYPPNLLGYCGPPDAHSLLSSPADEIARRARGFEGAWPYLEFLAARTGLHDPLDERVVEAYWVGNELVGKPSPADLHDFLRDRFAGQVGGTWVSAGDRAVVHHSFHVFEVYPWAALLRRTGNPAAVTVLDRCRIRTGTVTSVAGETATVVCRPLIWDGSALRAGPPLSEQVTWSANGQSLLPVPSAGDRVALHWHWICDILTDDQVEELQSRESRQLSRV